MYTAYIQINYKGFPALLTSSGAATRLGTKVIKPALGNVARAWHREMLPRHFQAGASGRYGYQQRTTKYQTIKEVQARTHWAIWRGDRRRVNVKAGGRQDLLYTGRTKAAVLRFPMIRPMGGRNPRVTIRMAAPSYVTMRGRGGKPPLGAEIVRLNNADLRTVRKLLVKHIHRNIKTLRTRKRKVIR